MSNPLPQAQEDLQTPERRLYSRQAIHSVAYVDLDEGNGGIVLNASEGGLAVQAVASLTDDALLGVRFQLSESYGWVEAKARITWTGKSRKLAGMEFVDLPETTRGRIKQWLVKETLPTGADVEPHAPAFSTRAPVAEPDIIDAEPLSSPESTPKFAVADQVKDATPIAERRGTSAVVPNFKTSSFDWAALLAPAAKPAREVIASPKEFGSSPVFSMYRAPAPRHRPERSTENLWVAMSVVVLLAIGSLVAGWAAGQGGLGKLSQIVHRVQFPNGGTDQVLSAPAPNPAARVSEIEIISADNQRWTIPFDGPLNAVEDSTHRRVDEAGLPPARKSLEGLRTWVPTRPRQAPAAAPTDIPKESLTAVPKPQTGSGSEDALTTSGAISSGALAGTSSLNRPAPPPPAGIVSQGQLIRRVDPIYPTIARDQHEQGTVKLNVAVGPDGVVRGVTLLSGPQLLVDAAKTAVRQWRYTPALMDGKPVEFQREVDLSFSLSEPVR